MILSGEALKYMDRYLEMFPEMWEPIVKEDKVQLTLF